MNKYQLLLLEDLKLNRLNICRQTLMMISKAKHARGHHITEAQRGEIIRAVKEAHAKIGRFLHECQE